MKVADIRAWLARARGIVGEGALGTGGARPMHIAKRGPWMRAAAAVLAACALLPLAQPQTRAAPPMASGVEWPTRHDGAPLRPLALSDVEHRFAQRFPGRIGRFTDDAGRVFVLRHVTEPTRMLHPAVDCFRATGYAIEQSRLERDERRRLWRCFVARRGTVDGEALRVCERIEGTTSDVDAFTDASAWFWAATLGDSRGPWLATTKVEAL